MISTISGTITTIVTPGAGNYAAVLTIANTGLINSQPEAIAGETFGISLTNLGSINGDVALYAGSALNNAGQITGQTAVSFRTDDVVVNAGELLGSATGVYLGNSSTVSNSGIIQGGYLGIYAPHGGYIFNTGTILQGGGGGFRQIGIDMTGGTLDNQSLISGVYAVLALGNVKIINSGTIRGQNIGLVASGNNQVSNTGLIIGNFTGISTDTASITNAGTITAISNGINASGLVQIINSGTLYGTNAAIALAGGGAVTNTGTIASGSFAIHDTNPSLALTLTVEAGAVFSGLVADQSGHGVIIMSGTGSSVFNMGTSFSGFSQIDFAPGAKWTLGGTAAELASGQTITGFTQGDAIDLDGFTTTSDTFISGTGLILSNGKIQETLNLVGNFSAADFSLSNTTGDIVINEITAPCFCKGTRIATARGNIPVEALGVGDLVKTATRGLQPIRWIGRRSYDGRFIAGNHLALPVRIRRHALGFNVPSRDLYVSPDHALCEGGVLVHAWRFLNGVSITQAENVALVEYYHIELDRHAVIFAENAPVESFLDTGCRNRFETAPGAPAAPAFTAQTPCLPRVEDGYYLARLRRRIEARAGIHQADTAMGPLRGNIDEAGPRLSGWAQNTGAREMPVELELVRGGHVVTRFLANRYRADLRHAGLGSGCHAFELALPPLRHSFTLRRAADGAVLGQAQAWMQTDTAPTSPVLRAII